MRAHANLKTWHVLDVKAIWIKEFAAALGRRVPVLGWLPCIENFGLLKNYEVAEAIPDPPLVARRFPLQRAFARRPFSWIAREDRRMFARLSRAADDPASPLIVTAPHYAPVAERWQGKVIYYVTDMLVAYGEDPRRIRAFDRRLCRRADLVCPNSQRIADYFTGEAGCSPEKIVVVPNATRAANLSAEVMLAPAALPPDATHLPRPVAGIIGNMAGNIDWELLEAAIEKTPWLSWLFVGPTTMAIEEEPQREARRRVTTRGGRVLFVGGKPYGELRDYARALDVAILPYRKREPTFSGSSTRYYEHLPTARPMVATRAFAELLDKEPLIRLVDTADEMRAALETLRATNFVDGFESARWQASLRGTWDARAATMIEALAARTAGRAASGELIYA